MDVELLNKTDESLNCKPPAKEVIETLDESETATALDNDDDAQNHAPSEVIAQAQSDVQTSQVKDSQAQLELAQTQAVEAQVQVQLAHSKLLEAQASVEVAVAKQGEVKALVRLAEVKAAATKARVKETQQNLEKLMAKQKQPYGSANDEKMQQQKPPAECPTRASPNGGHDNLHPLHARVRDETEELEQQVLDQIKTELRTLRHLSPQQLAQAQSPWLVNILSELVPPHLLAQAHFHANALQTPGMQQQNPSNVQQQMQHNMEQLQQIFQRRQQIMQQQQHQLHQNLPLQHPFQRMGNNGNGISAAIATELAIWNGRQAQLRAAVQQQQQPQQQQQQQQQQMAQGKPPVAAHNGATSQENSNRTSSPPPTAGKRMLLYNGPPQEDLSDYGGWPPGWTKIVYQRKDGKTRDRYWYGPNGIKYDSFVKVRRVFDQKRNASASPKPAIVPSTASEPETPQPPAQSEGTTAMDTTDPPTCLQQQEHGTTEQTDVQPIATEPVLPVEPPKTMEACHQAAHEEAKANRANDVDGPHNSADKLHEYYQEADYTGLIDKLRDSLLRSFLRGQPEVAISEILKATGYQTVSGGLKNAITYLIDNGLLELPSSECIKMTDGGLKSVAKLKGFSDKEVESMLQRTNDAANVDTVDLVTPLCSDEKKRAAQQVQYDCQKDMDGPRSDLEARLCQHSSSKRFKSQEQTANATAEKRRDETAERSNYTAFPNSGMERRDGGESLQDEATTVARNDESSARKMDEKTTISNKDLAVLIAKIQVFLHRMHEKGNHKLNESQIMEGIGHGHGFWGGFSQALKALENKGHIYVKRDTVELTQEGMQTISAVFDKERTRLNGAATTPTGILPIEIRETQIPSKTANLTDLSESADPPTQHQEKASNLPRSRDTQPCFDIDDHTSDDSDTEMTRIINQKMSQPWTNEAKPNETKLVVSNLEKQHLVRREFLNFCQSLTILERPTEPVIDGIFDLLSDGECHSKVEIFNASGYTYAEMFQFHKTIHLLGEQNVIQHTGQKCYQMSDQMFPCGRFNTATISRSCDKDDVKIVSECI